MRLSRPLLFNPPTVESDPWDLTGKYLEHHSTSDIIPTDSTEKVSFENNLILPQSFGYNDVEFLLSSFLPRII